MVYDIEFIRHVDGKAETLALHVIKLVGENVAEVVAQTERLFKQLGVVPRPDGYRIRGDDGVVVYEFPEPSNA